MKNTEHIKNVKEIKTVGELKKLLEMYPDNTELVTETSNAITELYVGITNPVSSREFENEILLIFGGKE